jgi:hypothetical protein
MNLKLLPLLLVLSVSNAWGADRTDCIGFLNAQTFSVDMGAAMQVLGMRLSFAQMNAIEQAHRVGLGQRGRDGLRPAAIGNYTFAQILRKASILRYEGRFNPTQIRVLMESGLVGFWSEIARGFGDASVLVYGHYIPDEVIERGQPPPSPPQPPDREWQTLREDLMKMVARR